MIVLNIYPKDVHVQLEFSVTQVNYILDYLDKCEIDINKEPKIDEECKKYVEDVFFGELDKLVDNIVKGQK